MILRALGCNAHCLAHTSQGACGFAGPQRDLPERRVPVGAVGIGLDRTEQCGAGGVIIIRADQGIG